MFTVHADCTHPDITRTGSYFTIRWDSGLAVQLDEAEWVALVDAVATNAPGLQEVIAARILRRDENEIRSAAELREAL
ncbi:hypothetical protein [Rhodococcus sp. 114MFTsu3.1]|uniref:hypothetical protein n=1 Tax=Rhodococcus sp. 114MFTsu3.1 TaxID=1172184 RepID=UPI0018CB9F3A|nr:hypothetical protein [Rhodococcus sp. 114MFTsu3.1]